MDVTCVVVVGEGLETINKDLINMETTQAPKKMSYSIDSILASTHKPTVDNRHGRCYCIL